MNDRTVQRITGVSGVAVGVVGLASVPLYFIYSGPPPAWDVLTRNLLTIIACMFLIMFFTGLRHLIGHAAAGFDWLASLIYGTGLIYVAIILVGSSLEVGPAIAHPSAGIDPTTTGPLADGDILIHGSIGRALTVLMLGAAGYAIRRTRVLPGWIGAVAYLIAAINLVFVPSLYFGNNAATFYSALGWGNTAMTASLITYWALFAGVASLRRASAPETARV